MMDIFGPTFGEEIIAAGLGGLPFSWGGDGDIQGRENLTAGQNAALDTVIAAHDPSKPLAVKYVLSQDLMAQFTATDAGAIRAAVEANAQFWLLWSAMQAQKDPMQVTNARFLAGWNALVQVLGADRMAAIAAALGVTV